MPVYYDPSEARVGMEKWQALFSDIGASPFPKLEEWTGADVAVVPRRVPPLRKRLANALEDGVLIQRKEKGDLLNSIPKLTSILQRMKKWPSIPFLVTIGDYVRTADNEVMVDGYKSGWNWSSMQGSLMAWQLRGGMLMQFRDAMDAADWYERLDFYVSDGKLKRDHVIFPHPQKIAGGIMDDKPWRVVLGALEGLGPKRASEVAEQFGTLAEALMWLSFPDETTVPGIGLKTIESVRRQLGLADGQRFVIDQDRSE